MCEAVVAELTEAALTPTKITTACREIAPTVERAARVATTFVVALLGILRALVSIGTKGVVELRVGGTPVVHVPDAVIATMDATVGMLWAPTFAPITQTGISSGMVTGVL